MDKVKIRYKTWYWGKYVYEGENMDGSRVSFKNEDWERFDESLHGIHNSIEYITSLHTTISNTSKNEEG